jgi:hypothetical protein
LQSTLTLLVPWICTDDTHNALAPDNLAVAADFFDRSRNFHHLLLKLFPKVAPQQRGHHTITLP